MLILIVLCFGLTSAQILQNGQCDNVALKNNFDIENFTGRWYGQRGNSILQNGDCSYIDIVKISGSQYSVEVSYVDGTVKKDISGVAVAEGTSASLNLILEGRSTDFNIIDTDYYNYALVYSCENVNSQQRNVYIWQLARETSFSDDAFTTLVEQTISSNFGLISTDLTTTIHSDAVCNVGLSSAVILSGQCDQSIPVENNLNLIRFSGEWRLISSYYNERQSGECNHVIYTSNGAGLTVQNRHVLNRQLYTTSGTAAFASNEQNGKLRVTVGTNIRDYWILDTDYDSYALAYSCENLDNNQQRIYSWKLSRTNTLTREASANIDAVINRTQLLENSLYIDADQSETACFNYPTFLPNEEIILAGQCSQDIPVVTDLNLGRFEGEWRLLSSYYNRRQTGSCNRATYTNVGNTLTIVNSHVVSRIRETSTGTASREAQDGRLTVNVGTNPPAPFWILTTDYDNYALAYSCENLVNNQQRISSWKLSRSNTFTNDANEKMNNITNDVDVLYDSYYNAVDQSDEACFHYPSLSRDEPVILPGQCDTNVEVVPSLNLERFSGEWHLISSYYNERQTGECNSADYTLKENSLTFKNKHVLNKELLTTSGTMTFASSVQNGKLLATVGSNTRDYWILDTDYDNYALAYSCENLANNQQRIFSWKLSRQNTLSSADNTKIDAIVNTVDALYEPYFTSADRSSTACFYYPDISTSEPVILNGQCDVNIPVTTNFDLEKFSGEWHLISSYYNERQTGECNSADYTLNENSLTFKNKHVLNKELLTTSGTMTFASSVQNGKLLATVGSNTRDYWILDTDYDNYALAYSCENLANNQQRIFSWKLSRQNTLSSADNTKIDAIVNTVDALYEPYFTSADRSSTACFYYPDISTSEPVILNGQCDVNIPVTTNFDLEKFSGEWHLISSYYNERQTGECNSADYTLKENSLTFKNKHVLNKELLTTSGTMTFASSVQNGKLLATVGSNTRDYWILDTDYDNYALAYSCENLANNRQRIFSWKLSRQNTLSSADNTKIDAIVNTVDALYEPYFTSADRSSTACFYYPDISTSEPVIFNGQCDGNISVTANFDLEKFSGEWRLISTYYNERQSGVCNRAQYENTDGNSFSIVNSNVVGGRLSTVSGSGTFASQTVRDGKLVVTVGSGSTDYWILTTDYDSYALAYSCENINMNQFRVYSWKLSRTNSLSAEAISEFNIVSDRVPTIRDRYFSDVDQSESACLYLPAPDASKPVVFRGQCDQTIQVVRDFDVSRYMGQWYDIESYPSTFQYGTCNSAFYSRRGNFVDVVNTQVVQQTISVRQGIASFVENEQTAKLNLTIGSTARDYWVISTDYSTYALVYSCLNINNQYMQVGAWKLSKSRQLTQSAQTAINNAMANIKVLDSQYFIQRDHTSAGCTFNTDIQPGEPVYLDGTCPTNISPVSDFAITRFTGTWYEIESYPIDLWAGQCSLQQFFIADTDSLSFISRSVQNEELIDITGTATRVSGSANGQLTIAIETNSGSIDVPFAVIAVDYEDYALTYGCVQVTSNLRRVYSWKLSRTKELSSNAKSAINTVVLANPDLLNRFYATVDQSESGCFYLPDIPLGQAVIIPGQCNPNITVATDFNLERFLGRWRLISSYYTHRQSGECNQLDYSMEGETIRVKNMHVLDSELRTVSGTATLSADGSGKLSVSISRRTVDFWILASDYNNYALAYSCSNVNTNQMRVHSWKLSREATLSDTSQTAINNVINEINVLNERFYAATDNSDDACFYYPAVDASEPVIFDGQCNETIPVVRNFQPELYTGVWYDVESYPSTFQYGTCNTARYSLSGNNMIVNNTQIIDGVMSVREAVGVFPEGNTVGKLSLNMGSSNRDYWILTTDYYSYALIYSCINLDANRKQVGTWKMSRSRELSELAKYEISSTMSKIRELDQRYFITRNHTDSGCFYHREQSQDSVILSGSCDTSIPAMPNFNLTAFQGVWNEIETYPSEMMSGECMSQEYSQGTGSSLNVVQRNVRLETLFENAGVATQTSNDNSGKFMITVQGGLGATIPFWVLSTDYTDYALAYGCVDLDNNERQVYSWKLSRHQELSPAANEQIEIVKANIAVLDSRYYKTIDQSDEACFHLPDFSVGESVILPGQCDANIPVVKEFDAQKYSGVWYQIEKYFQRFETGGNCTGARYTLNSDTGVVTVLNWQLVNGALDTIEGTATVTSTDNSAKLTVRLPIRSSDPNNPEFRETSLYVLDTDYTSYSLAYSCVNLEGNRRQVGAWKLSRSRTMSNAGNNAIDAYMANRQELQSTYFVAVEQGDSCPEPNSATLIRNSIMMLVLLYVSLVYLS